MNITKLTGTAILQKKKSTYKSFQPLPAEATSEWTVPLTSTKAVVRK